MFFVLLLLTGIEARMNCEKTLVPLEMGQWKHDLKQIDSLVIENRPISAIEGQTYVYENYFPEYTITYINIYNLAIKTCGARAQLKAGGVGCSSVLIVLHADINQEIRSVIDIWGKKKLMQTKNKKNMKSNEFKNMNSLYLFKELRTVNHNNMHMT